MTRWPIAREDQRGATLAEVLVAAVIIAVALAALASAIPLANYGIQEGNQLSAATFLATQRLEQVRRARWVTRPSVDELGVSSPTTAPPRNGGATTFGDENPLPAPFTGYTRQVRVLDCASGCNGIVGDDLRQVIVTVSFRPLSGIGQAPADKSVVLTMLIAKR
jgi:type II secretory pathway pseudopilin PulG